MILDKQNELSNAQAVTVSAASVNQIDQGPNAYTGNARGQGRGLIFFNIDTDFTAAGEATMQFALRSSPNADMSGAITHLLTAPIPVAQLKRGNSLRNAGVTLPMVGMTQRYVDVQYIVANGPFTAGNVSARFALDQPNSVGA